MYANLRKWQRDAIEILKSLRAAGKDRALIAACPGSGKTKFAVAIIAADLTDGVIDFAVVVVPSRHLKTQWKRQFALLGIKSVDDIDNGTLEERMHRGMNLFNPEAPVLIVTYQQVSSFPDLFAVLSARHRVFAVFDEIHHADDEADYGTALVTAFTDSIFKLSLSGTPFNTKGGRLAFCETKPKLNEEGQYVNETVTDYEYSYGQALNVTGQKEDDPNVVRPVTFLRWNGYARWRIRVSDDEVKERVFNGGKKTDPLAPLLDPDIDNLKKMVRAALNELEQVRRHQSDAGMLIVAMDGLHADRLANLVRSFGVMDVVVVKYDIPGAAKLITDFEQGKQRVIVAVKMIAEGVDITRLRVGAYASNVLTELFFAQFVGRFLRWDKRLDATQFASIVIPEHITLIKYAQNIEAMVSESVIVPPKEPGETGPEPGSPETIILKQGDGAEHGAIQHGRLFEADETTFLREWMRRANCHFSIDMAKNLWAAAQGDFNPTDVMPTATTEVERDWSAANDKLVGRIVIAAKQKGRSEWTYETVQAWANRQVGIPKKDKLTPGSVLQRRYEQLERLFLSLKRNGDDAAIAG